MSDKHMEAAALAYDPKLFSADKHIAHMAASPLKVEIARHAAMCRVAATVSARDASMVAGAPELVKRLSARVEMVNHGNGDVRDHPDEDCREAAAVILALTADRERLRTELRNACETYAVHGEQPPERWLAALKEPANA